MDTLLCNSTHPSATYGCCIVLLILGKYRRNATFGVAIRCDPLQAYITWGARGPEFKSRRSDQRLTYLRLHSRGPVCGPANCIDPDWTSYFLRARIRALAIARC